MVAVKWCPRDCLALVTGAQGQFTTASDQSWAPDQRSIPRGKHQQAARGLSPLLSAEDTFTMRLARSGGKAAPPRQAEGSWWCLCPTAQALPDHTVGKPQTPPLATRRERQQESTLWPQWGWNNREVIHDSGPPALSSETHKPESGFQFLLVYPSQQILFYRVQNPVYACAAPLSATNPLKELPPPGNITL